MKKARLSISEKDESIVIDRSVFASRHKGKLCEVTLDRGDGEGGGIGGVLQATANMKDLSPEAQYWRQKYMNLKRELREEEEDVEHLVELTAEREARLQELSKLLERKLDLLMSAPGAASLVPEATAKLDKQRRLLRFYEQMTGLTLQEEEGGFKCTVRNKVKRLVTRFRVTEDGDEACYLPLANAGLLPDYLRAEIRCEKPMLSVMLADVLQSLYADEE